MDITAPGGMTITSPPAPTAPPTNGAGVPGGYTEGTTGGGNASSITVSSASAFISAVSGSNARVVIVSGRFDMGG